MPDLGLFRCLLPWASGTPISDSQSANQQSTTTSLSCLLLERCELPGLEIRRTAGLLDQKLKSEPEGFNELRTAKACLLSAREFSNHFQSLNRAIWPGILLIVCRSCYSKIFSSRRDGSRKVSMLRRCYAVNSFEGVNELIDAGETD